MAGKQQLSAKRVMRPMMNVFSACPNPRRPCSFEGAAFTVANAGTFGREGRGQLRGTGARTIARRWRRDVSPALARRVGFAARGATMQLCLALLAGAFSGMI